MPKTEKDTDGTIKFEDALAELESIVNDMESGDLDLEKSLKQYERGSKLLQFCESKLKASAEKIEILRKSGQTLFKVSVSRV